MQKKGFIFLANVELVIAIEIVCKIMSYYSMKGTPSRAKCKV